MAIQGEKTTVHQGSVSHSVSTSESNYSEAGSRRKNCGSNTCVRVLSAVLILWCIAITVIAVWAFTRTFDRSGSVSTSSFAPTLSGVMLSTCDAESSDSNSNGCAGKVASLHPLKGEALVGAGVNVRRMISPVQEMPQARRSRMGTFPYNASCHVNCIGSQPSFIQFVCSRGRDSSHGQSVKVSEIIPLDVTMFAGFIRASSDVYVAAGYSSLQAFRVESVGDKSPFPQISKGPVFKFPTTAFASMATVGELTVAMVDTSQRLLGPSLARVDPLSLKISVFQPTNVTAVGLNNFLFYTACALDRNHFVSIGGSTEIGEDDVVIDIIQIGSADSHSVNHTTGIGIGSFRKVSSVSVPGSSARGFIASRNLQDMSRPVEPYEMAAGVKEYYMVVAWYDKQVNEGVKDVIVKWSIDSFSSKKNGKLAFVAFGTVQNGYAGSRSPVSNNLIAIVPDSHFHQQQMQIGNSYKVNSGTYLVCFPNGSLNGTITGSLRKFETQTGLNNLISTGRKLEFSKRNDSAGDSSQGFCDGAFTASSQFMVTHFFSSRSNEFRGAHSKGSLRDKAIGVFVKRGDSLAVQTGGVVHVRDLHLEEDSDSALLVPGREYFSDMSGQVVMQETVEGSEGLLKDENNISLRSKVGVAMSKEHLLLGH
eukprot:Nk52_evm2s400 gene=Nk52_evmTU2s400